MSELMNEHQWSMDECLIEFTNVRADMAVLLQPRPRAVKPPQVLPPPRPTGGKPPKGGGKSKTKGSKGSGPAGKGKQTWVSEYKVGDD